MTADTTSAGHRSWVTMNLPADATRDIGTALEGSLADIFALYLNIKNFHWHMSGPRFRDYHLLLDEQSDQIFTMIDPIAERARKIGSTTQRSMGQIARFQRILNNDASYVEPQDILAELRDDNLRLTSEMRQVHNICAPALQLSTIVPQPSCSMMASRVSSRHILRFPNFSLSGSRVAAINKRFRCLNRSSSTTPMRDGPFKNGVWVYGISNEPEYIRKSEQFALTTEHMHKIKSPALILEGENNLVFKGQDGKLATEMKAQHKYVVMRNAEGAAEHCHMGVMRAFHQTVFDWLHTSLALQHRK